MRLQRALHILSALVLLGLAALGGVSVASAWRAMHASSAGALAWMPILRFLAALGVPTLALSVLYVRPFRNGRWISLLLLAALTLQLAPVAVRMAMRASRYAAMAHTPAALGPRPTGTGVPSQKRARLLAREFARQTAVVGGLTLWFAAQMALVALSRRYWERIPDEPRPSTGMTPQLPPPPS